MELRLRYFVAVSLIFALALSHLTAHAISSCDLRWSKTFGRGVARSVQQTSDGGYIIAGYTGSLGAGSEDVYLFKTNSNGDVLWFKTFGGGESDNAESVQQTSDGGYIIAGYTCSFDIGSGDVYLIKTDSKGSMQWNTTFGGSSFDIGYSVQQTSDGGYIIAGYSGSFGIGGGDVYLIKTDSKGSMQWSNIFGGSSDERGYSVQQTSDGGYIIAGYSGSFGTGLDDVYLVKTDSKGDVQWSNIFGGSSEDIGYSVQQTSDGGYIIAGYTGSFGIGSGDVYLIKTDSKGDMQWSNIFGGSGDDCGYSVQQTSDGGYIITGFINSFGIGSGDVYLIKTDSKGSMQWNTTFGGSSFDIGYSVQQTSDGGYIIAGFINSFGMDNGDVYLARFNSDICKLTMFSNYGSTNGAGDYPAGTIVTISVPEPIITDSGTRYVFTGWASSSPGGYNGPESSAEVTMNNDITQTAQWKIQYSCVVGLIKDGGSVAPGFGWYDEGSVVTLTAEPLTVGHGIWFLIRSTFSGWQGDITSNSPVISVTMDGPKHLIAVFEPDFSHVYIVGALSAVTITVTAIKFRKKRIEQAATVALVKQTLNQVTSSSKPTSLEDMAKNYNKPVEEIKAIINIALEDNLLQGTYLTDGKFITMKALKQLVTDRINSSDRVIQLPKLAQQINMSIEVFETVVYDLIKNGTIVGKFTEDRKGFVTDKVIERTIRKKIE